MLLAGKAAWAGIVFLLLTTGRSGPLPTPLASAANLSKEMPSVAHPDDVKKMQETLKGKGHYRGEVDGVFGLRTRAWSSSNNTVDAGVTGWESTGQGYRGNETQ